MQDLEDILEGQDLSLVWRRDGLSKFPIEAKDRMNAYRHMASLKTGSFFRLLGHLVLEDTSMDETLTLVAYVLRPPFTSSQPSPTNTNSRYEQPQLALPDPKRQQKPLLLRIRESQRHHCRGPTEPRTDLPHCAGPRRP